MNRSVDSRSAEPRITVGDWELQPNALLITRNGTETKLSPRAMDVLVYFAERAGEAVTHEELLAAFWRGPNSSTNSVHKIVADLRHAFGNGGGESSYIETVPKRGYRLTAHVQRVKPSSQMVAEAPSEMTQEVTIFSIGTRTALLRPIDSSRVPLDAKPFVERIQREILARLGQANASIRTQKVPAQARVTRPNLAVELGVDYTVGVDAHEASDRILASIVLTPTSSDSPSHQERIDSLEPLVLIEKITHAVDDLALLLDAGHVQRMREWGTKNVHAYRHALEAELLRNNVNVVSFRKAEVCLTRAIAEDPSFGLAYELQTATYYDLGMMGNAASYEHARQGVKTLLDKGTLARIDAKSIAFMKQMYRVACLTNPIDAETFWREEILRNADNPEALRRYADLLAGAGLVDESERYLDRAIPLDESNHDWYEMDYATLAGVRGNYEGAIRAMKTNLDRFGDYTVTLHGLVETLAHMGRFTEAEFYLTRLEASDHEGGWAYSAKMRLMAFRGEIPLGSEALKRALASPLTSNLSRGATCFLVGDVENGVRYWRKIKPQYLELIWRFKALMENYYAEGVTEDARYQALLDEMMIGRGWPLRLLNGVKELEPLTGIAATTRITPRIGGVRSLA